MPRRFILPILILFVAMATGCGSVEFISPPPPDSVVAGSVPARPSIKPGRPGTIVAGEMHTCAVLGDGTVTCWGYNIYGQVGLDPETQPMTPVVVDGVSGATALAAGLFYTCALLGDGTVTCWGDNTYGQLGDGGTQSRFTPAPVDLTGSATQVVAGTSHTCALLAAGTVTCWGDNTYGQLGDGTAAQSTVPVAVAGLSNVIAIAGGGYHTCALLADGTARCWGYNIYGQLGDGTAAQSTVPVAVAGLSDAVAVTAGTFHTCALLADGTARCWGDNSSGELGDGSNITSVAPVPVLGVGATGELRSIAVILAGQYGYTMAVLADGTLVGWGSNDSWLMGAELPQGSACLAHDLGGGAKVPTGEECWAPTPIPIGSGRSLAIATGAAHACALITDTNGLPEAAFCWGDGSLGERGDGTLTGPAGPTPVHGLP